MERPAKRMRVRGTVVLDVRGRHFRLLPELIMSQPCTLLARLLDAIGPGAQEPIFIDANPDRFSHILDWYRYGEMFLPEGMPLQALLRNCAWFMLSEKVKVNGINHSVIIGSNLEAVSHFADDIRTRFISEVIQQWRNFDTFLLQRIVEIQTHCYNQISSSSAKHEQRPRPDGPFNRVCMKMDIWAERWNESSQQHVMSWTYPDDICNMARAKVFALKLREYGFECDLEGSLDDPSNSSNPVRLLVSLKLDP